MDQVEPKVRNKYPPPHTPTFLTPPKMNRCVLNCHTKELCKIPKTEHVKNMFKKKPIYLRCKKT